MGTLLSVLFVLFILAACIFIGCLFGLERRYYYYAVLALVFSFDISYLSESNSLFDVGIIGAFAFSSVYAIYLLTILPIGRVVRSVIDILLSVLILLPIVLKTCVGIEWFGNDVLLTVFQTDLKEAALFVSDSLSWMYIMALIVLMGGVVGLNYKSCKQITLKKQIFSYAISLFLLILSASIAAHKCSGFHYASMIYENYLAKIHFSKRSLNVDYDVFSKTEADSLTCVVVVGESLSRDYMSAYGYDVKTTPHMDALIEQEELLRFDNVFATDIFTVICVPRMLTSESSYCQNMDYTLVDLLKSNGFGCYWLSNQSRGGFDDNAISVLAENSDREVFDDEVKGHDENLLPYVKECLSVEAAKKLIIVHFVGNHEPARHHYPQRLPYLRNVSYSDENTYHYENSIIYNDSVITALIDMLPERNTVLFYASDHGNKPGLTRLYDRFDFSFARIPLLIHFSENLRSSRAYNNLQEHTQSYWSNDLLFNLVCGVLDIHNPEILAPKYDLSSEEYGLTKEDINLCNGRFGVDD